MTYSGKIPITGMCILMKAVPKGHKRKKGWRCYSLHQNWGDYEELSLKNDPEQVKRLRVRIRDQGSKGTVVDGIPYRDPDQGEVIDESSWLQLQNIAISLGKVAQQAVVNPEDPWNGWSW